jgi:gas vesicle protein
MADHDNLPYIVIERHSGGASPFIWGLLLGAGAALLFAPRSGEETQEEIRERARRLRTAAETKVDSVRGSVTDSISRTRNQFQDRLDSMRESVDSRAREAVDGGRRVASDARSEIRRRVAEAKEEIESASGPGRQPGTRNRAAAAPPPPPPPADVVVTDVDVEEAEGRPGLS